jgi:ABC-2 type transport system permease protein
MLILLYAVSVGLMILIPVALAAALRRFSPAPWLLFGIGCLTFFVSQAVHLPLNQWLADIGLLPAAAASSLPVAQTALIAGLTAGLCEELARAAGYALLRRFRPAWLDLPGAAMLGLGHGGFESMTFGAVLTAATAGALIPLIGTDLTQLGLPADQLAALRAQLAAFTAHPWNGAYPALERVLAISAQVIFSLLVWKAFRGAGFRRNWFYLPLAVLYHALIDFAAVYGVHFIPDRPALLEGIFAALLIPGYVWAALQFGAYQKEHPAGVPRPKLRGELDVLWTATRKELLQLWRTNRLLVSGAVFLVFGMGSPLLAKLVPDIFQSVAGMEQFAALIPTPTAADAMAQYVKNLTQFGFVLAILLGMGAVAGEKERGVAPMILSKPMPRWAFLAGKFVAQGVLYLGCFALSGAGAYYYTAILFGPPQPENFLLMNLLLWLWLMTFVALALLGSTLGKSTVGAGGIGAVLAVGMLLAGSIPRYGGLLPGALAGWAGQAGAEAAHAALSAGSSAASGGALASAAAAVVLSLVLAIGAFEQQEL